MPKSYAYQTIVILLLVSILGILYQAQSTQSKIYEIEKERHIEALYSTYRANMSSCRAEAEEAEMDEEFIQENCVDEINNSIIGQWLNERRPDLVITE